MSGIDWFRWHHGSVTDPKFQLVARKSGASLSDVIAVWAYLLESASASDDRGDFGEIDEEAIDCMFNFPDDETRTADILRAMTARGIIADGYIVSWEKRQPKREREDFGASERKRKQREKESEAVGNVTPIADDHDDMSPCHAMSRHVTPKKAQSRVEESKPLNHISVVALSESETSTREPPPENATFQEPKKIAGDESGTEPAEPSRIGELCKALRRIGIDASPHLQAWAEILPAHSDAEIIAAAEAARERKPGHRLHLNYVLMILRDRAPPANSRSPPKNREKFDPVAFVNQTRKTTEKDERAIDSTAQRMA